jgi:hypothetical protein
MYMFHTLKNPFSFATSTPPKRRSTLYMGKKGKQPPPAEPPPPPPPRIIRIFYRGDDDAKVSVTCDANGGLEALFDAAAIRLGWRPASVFKDDKLVTEMKAIEDLDSVRFQKELVLADGRAPAPFAARSERVVKYVSQYDELEAAQKAVQAGAAVDL